MHLIAATPGEIADGSQPVDTTQSPAELVVISAADTELAALAMARAEMPAPPGLRLMRLQHLAHPMSVDLHLESCATHARLVIARILGGAPYWSHGLAQYSARLAEAGVAFVALPGDDKPDAELASLSTVPPEDYAALHAFLTEGGPANAAGFLAHARAMIQGAARPAPARPFLKAGLYWPGQPEPALADLRAHWAPGAPVIPIVFYRAILQGGGLAPVDRLTKALLRAGLAPLPVFVTSLKDDLSAATLQSLFTEAPPEVILNLTSFATAAPGETGRNPLAAPAANGAPVLQAILAAGSQEAWEASAAGLSARDVAMNVALPEVDGRLITRAIAFKDAAWRDEATECEIATWGPKGDRITFLARLAAAWARLRATPPAERRTALILANYPNKDGRLANGVGLDTPASTTEALRLMAGTGYDTTGAPETSAELMATLMSCPTNWLTDRAERQGGIRYPLSAYKQAFAALPWAAKEQILTRWGPPDSDPFIWPEIPPPEAAEGSSSPAPAFALSAHVFGKTVVAIQPARGYNIDPDETYHSPDLPPPHHYLAFHFWLRDTFGADAVVHMGKHGNLEWLPGKGLALSETCWPEIALGPLPNLYPFIVNDPGEGSQAKRRTAAVVLDHLTPPMTRAETYGPLAELEALVDEYYEAASLDPTRAARLSKDILSLAETTGIAADAGLTSAEDLTRLDAWLCEIKEAQIRDGLHIFGQSPIGPQARDLALALARLPRGDRPSLLRALAEDLGLGFDPLTTTLSDPWAGPFPEALGPGPWRTAGDTVERLEALSIALADGETCCPGPASEAVLQELQTELAPAIAACGPAEAAALLTALDGRAIPPGPSGAPTRGRPDVLPTGRNFYSVDARAVPTPTAYSLGRRSAELLVETYLQEHGDWPRAMLLTAWGTANMRTGGDDIAQGLALMGVKPTWDAANRRVTGFEILPLSLLGRPRVDVTLRVSGFFRDAFPQLIALFGSAAKAVQALDEPAEENPASQSPGPRVYGAKPGAYGAGLQALIDEGGWATRADFAEAYLQWGGFAYEAGQEGAPDRAGLEARLRQTDAIVQNQDNREHDLLDSDDYYQFEGGAAAAVATLQGRDRPVYHNDHSRPERPVIRRLEEEISRVMRARVVNPKWIEGVKRHGYKGAFEIAATVDYLFAFAATTGAVKPHHFDLTEAAFLADDATRAFIEEANAPALAEIARRLQEAIDRGLWTPRSNSARARIAALL
ncbi:cobaltochelatase subunit CobN [Pseudoroseicyclus sp. CXY001]|uniref:cobaltochelatase subunit CobN n=1 Tax=Pseudoroseicyclus sp. CXY001 TaxID=3242492 RepID=UPI00358DC797